MFKPKIEFEVNMLQQYESAVWLTCYGHFRKKYKNNRDGLVEENHQNFQKFFVDELDKKEAR